MDYLAGIWYLTQEKGMHPHYNQYLVNLASFGLENSG